MDNPPKLFNTSNPKSKKQYTCCGCGGKIPKGVRYRRDSGLWDGSFDDFAIHEECWLVMNMLQEYCYGNNVFSEAFEQDWCWHYSPSRYNMKNERKALARVYWMLRRVDKDVARKTYQRGKSARFNNRRWAAGGIFGQSCKDSDRKDGTVLADAGV